MERDVLTAYCEHSPTSPWRAALRAFLFARTNAYIEDYAANKENNMMTIAAMDVNAAIAARKMEKERRAAEMEEKGVRPSAYNSSAGLRRRGDFYQYTDTHDDTAEATREIEDAIADSGAHGFRRSHRSADFGHRRRSSAGGGGSQETSERSTPAPEGAGGGAELATFGPMNLAGLPGGPSDTNFSNSGGRRGGGGRGEEDEDGLRGEETNIYVRKKSAEDDKSIRRRYDLADIITCALVVLNAVFLAMWDPLAPQNGILPYLDEINIAFSFLFLIDLALHIACLGLIVFKADKWYIFDALVVIAGVVSAVLELTISLSSFALGAMRAFRVLALLRSVRTFETIRIIIKTIAGTIIRLRHLLMLFAMFLLVFGIAGVSQYSSRLQTRCIHGDYWNDTRKLELLQDFYRLHPDEWPYGCDDSAGGCGNATNATTTVQETTTTITTVTLTTATETTSSQTTPLITAANGTLENDTDTTTETTTTTTTAAPTTSSSSTTTAAPTTLPTPRPTSAEPNRGMFWPPSLPQESPVATHGLNRISFEPRKMADFVRYQSYDLFTSIVREGYHDKMRREYHCQGLLYTLNATTFAATECAAEFNNEAYFGGGFGQYLDPEVDPLNAHGGGGPFGLRPRTFDPSAYPFEFYALVTLPPPDGRYYALQGMIDDTQSLSSWQSVSWRDQTCDLSDALFLHGYRCPQEYRCERLENPLRGHVGFDNLGEAMLTLFVAVTYEGWYHAMTWTMSSVDRTAALFFIAVVTIGALFITNLAIVELTVQYEVRIKEEWRFQNERKLRMRKESTNWLWALYDKIAEEAAISNEDCDEELADELDELDALQRLSFHVRQVIKKPLFEFLIVACIVSNVVILGLYSSKSGESYQKLSDIAHYCFVSALAAEMIARFLAAEGIWGFFVGANFLNTIDCIVLIFGIADVFLNDSANMRPAMALRLGRVVWGLAHFSPTFMRWVLVVVRTLKASLVIGILLMLLVFLFGVVGLYLFGGTFCNLYDSDLALVLPDNTDPSCPMRPRSNFDTIASAMLTTLIITSVDGWDQIMYDGMDARGGIFCIYFIVVLLVCKYLVVNLLIGIFLHESALARKLEDERLLRLGVAEDKTRGHQRRRRDTIKQLLSSFFATPEQAKVDDLDPRFSKFQLQLQKFVETSGFKIAMSFLTFISCLCIAMESPLRAPDTKEEALLLIADLACNGIFALEMLTKIVAYGVIVGPQSHFRRDPWNWFDALAVAISFVSQGLFLAKKGDRTQPVFSALRVIRAVRPIRFSARAKGFRLLFQALANSFVSLVFLFFMLFALMTLWGVMGVQWFAGAYSRCTDLSLDTKDLCTAAGQVWVTPYNNFDNMAQAYLSLMAISTTENWADIMYNGMDAAGRGKGPMVNEGKRFAVYFSAFMAIGGMYFVALLISVLIQSYQDAKRLFPQSRHFLNPHEQAWVYSHYDLISKIPLVDYDSTATTGAESFLIWIRSRCRAFERSPLFDLLVYCTIIVGFIVAAVDHYPKSSAMTNFISISSLLFAVWFCIEMSIRIISEGPRGFFKSAWNRFDLAITILNLAGIIMELALSQTTFVTVFRLLRAVRLLRLVRKSRTLQSVLKRILHALYALKNTVAVLFLVYFIFGVMGMRMFGRVSYSAHINQRQNFNDIINAMLIMVRCSTGGEWLQLVESIVQPPPLCDMDLDGCITPAIAQTYFIVYEIVAQYIFINLFASVIFDIFTETNEVAMTVSNFDAGQFVKLWMCFDPEGTYRIESQFLVSFLRGIPRQCILSLGPISEARRRLMEIAFLKQLDLTELGAKVELQDIIRALLQRYYSAMIMEKEEKLERRARLLEAAKRRERGDDEDEEEFGEARQKGSGGRASPEDDAAGGAGSGGAQDARPALNHDTSRTLRRSADKVFRRKARNLHRPSSGSGPASEEQHVARRYAINVIEQYYKQSLGRRREHEAIQREREEMREKIDRFERDLQKKTQIEIEAARRQREGLVGASSGGGGLLQDLGEDYGDDAGGAAGKRPTKGKALWQKVRGKLIASAKFSAQQQQQNEQNAEETKSGGPPIEDPLL